MTAEFNRNVLHVINRELDADFMPDAFEHVAFFDRRHEWIEMRLRARRPCSVLIGDLGLRVEFAAGEELRTEISAKFTRTRLEAGLPCRRPGARPLVHRRAAAVRAVARAAGLGATRRAAPDVQIRHARTVGFRLVEIKGTSAIVAGGASGLGEATVRRLHADGAQVLIADLNEQRGQALAAELGDGAAFHRTDVTDADSVAAAVAQAAACDGGLMISVCCAGISWAEKVAGSRGPHALESFETVIRVNLIGTFNVLRFAAAAMLQHDRAPSGERGVCINTASIAAFDGQVGQISYCRFQGRDRRADAARGA